MRVICNEYLIDHERLIIEHDVLSNEFYYTIRDRKSFEVKHHSESISNLIACRAKAFEFMGVQTS